MPSPNFERRHFQFIADTIAQLDNGIRPHVARHFVRSLKSTNPKFVPDAFLKACGVLTIGELEERF